MRRSTAVGLTVISALLLSVVGLALIYSASRRVHGTGLVARQFLWLLLGLTVFGAVLMQSRARVFGYRWFLYAGGILLLALTLQYGIVVRGDRSWLNFFGLFHLQASEIMKPMVVLVLAGVAERMQLGTLERRTGLGLQVLLLAIPVGLILLQPDTGTAVVYLAFLVGWLFIQGHWRGSIALTVMGAGLALGLFLKVLFEEHLIRLGETLAVSPAEGVLDVLASPYGPPILAAVCALVLVGPYWRGRQPTAAVMLLLFVLAGGLGYQGTSYLAGYQRQRLEVFLNPYQSPLTSGYNIIQSQIAVGSGGWFGQGWLEGSQSQLGFIPELWTDFIFSVAVEELGLLFGAFLLGLLFILIFSTFALATLAPDWRGYLTGSGVALILILHTTINVGVCVGLIPVLGLPLPFVSYGGSFLVTNWLMIGLTVVVSRPSRGHVVGNRIR